MADVKRVPAADPAAAIRVLEKDGAVILEDFASIEDVDKVNNDLFHGLAVMKDQPMEFFPDTTETLFCTYGRSQTAREKWMFDDSWQKIRKHFLSSTHVPYQARKEEEFSTDPILSTSFSTNIPPGTEAQLLHRDDIAYMSHHPDRTKTGYDKSIEQNMSILLPGCKFTAENGATRIILGSHLWPNDRRADPEDTVPIIMDKGDALVILGSVVHGGGHNQSKGDMRILHSFVMCRSYLRQEANMFPLFPRKEVETWSKQAQELACYQKGHLFIGHSDLKDPIEAM